MIRLRSNLELEARILAPMLIEATLPRHPGKRKEAGMPAPNRFIDFVTRSAALLDRT